MSSVELGFLEDCEPWQVESRLFPSKFGGKPAWLSLEDIPSPGDLECEICKNILSFLCQVYAPFENDPNNFHRTLFVFVCRNPKCCQRNSAKNIKVFRSVLRRDNKFYSFDPPLEEEDPTFSLKKWVNLCKLCGCSASKNCSKCKVAYYCCREHQVLDWKDGHKNICTSEIQDKNLYSKFLFPEKEIVLDVEESDHEKVDEKAELEKFKQLKVEGKTGTLTEVAEKEIEAYAKVDEDETFNKFKERVDKFKQYDQIIRYDLNGEPLWIAKEPVPSSIPNCEYCGSPRQFELQIMPQMLAIIKEHELDWGIIAIYTCASSCCDGKAYKREFVFKQDVALTDL